MTLILRASALLALLSTAAVPAIAQMQSGTMPAAILPESTIPDAKDVAYPGTLTLEVDATDVDRRIVHVRQTVPVAAPGPMVLMMPAWLPGKHAARGPMDKVANIRFAADGRTIGWRRDPVDIYAFHLDVPAGARAVEVRFDYLSPLSPDLGRIEITREMMNIQWESVSMYPAGYYTRRIPIEATLKIPAGWQAATALTPARAATADNRIAYRVTDYETLQDSPVFAGKYFRSDDLGQGVTLATVADSAKELAAPDHVIAKHRALVDQAVKLFGARHFDHYVFLNAITDRMGGIGLEHHRSSENQNDPGYFIDWEGNPSDHGLLPHEFTHSWNGKYRRGKDLFTPDFRTPMRNSMLWVYEGQTQFWGWVLEARSGMGTKQNALDQLAGWAAQYGTLPGRTWRPLVDTTNDPIISARRPKGWVSEQRNEDYYVEGLLMWSEIDAMIRKGTNGQRGMDDFARAFFGVNDGDWGTLTYDRHDVAKTLNQIMPYDWEAYLDRKVYQVAPEAPLGAIAASGYRLEYREEPTALGRIQAKNGSLNLLYSLGLAIAKDGKVTAVQWDGPAFDQGIARDDLILAVGESAYSADALKRAVTAAKGGNRPIRLTVKRGDMVRAVDVTWNGGLRYPHLVKVGKGDGPLDRLLAPR